MPYRVEDPPWARLITAYRQATDPVIQRVCVASRGKEGSLRFPSRRGGTSWWPGSSPGRDLGLQPSSEDGELDDLRAACNT